jgi:hypothetical protein
MILLEPEPSAVRTSGRNWRAFFSLSAGHKIFFCIELRLKPLEIEQELFFELLPRTDASWWSLEYQFAMASSREMMRDLVRVASSPPNEAMEAS